MEGLEFLDNSDLIDLMNRQLPHAWYSNTKQILFFFSANQEMQ